MIVLIKLVVLLYICHVSSLFHLSVAKKREPKNEHYIIKYLHLELKLHDTTPLDRPTTHQKLYNITRGLILWINKRELAL